MWHENIRRKKQKVPGKEGDDSNKMRSKEDYNSGARKS